MNTLTLSTFYDSGSLIVVQGALFLSFGIILFRAFVANSNHLPNRFWYPVLIACFGYFLSVVVALPMGAHFAFAARASGASFAVMFVASLWAAIRQESGRETRMTWIIVPTVFAGGLTWFSAYFGWFGNVLLAALCVVAFSFLATAESFRKRAATPEPIRVLGSMTFVLGLGTLVVAAISGATGKSPAVVINLANPSVASVFAGITTAWSIFLFFAASTLAVQGAKASSAGGIYTSSKNHSVQFSDLAIQQLERASRLSSSMFMFTVKLLNISEIKEVYGLRVSEIAVSLIEQRLNEIVPASALIGRSSDGRSVHVLVESLSTELEYDLLSKIRTAVEGVKCVEAGGLRLSVSVSLADSRLKGYDLRTLAGRI